MSFRLSTPPIGHVEREIVCRKCKGTGLASDLDGKDGIECGRCDGTGFIDNPETCECAECNDERRHDEEVRDDKARDDYERKHGAA